MIDLYARSFRVLGTWGWKARFWAHENPRKARLFIVLFLIILSIGRAQAAHAAGFLPEDSDFKDSAGNKFSQYSTINIDGGDALHPDKVIVNFFVQMIWAVQYFLTGVILWLFKFLLGFEWVQWLSTPFNTLANWLHVELTSVNWIPFALMLSALVGGIAIFIGRVAGGLWEMLIAAVMASMTTGILSNPVATLTAADGLLQKAQQFGGELASSIVVDEAQTGSGALSDSVIATLMDNFIRIPYQVVSYLQVLPDACQEQFNTFIQSGTPQAGLRTCAPDAANSHDNPSALNIMNALVNFGGVGVLSTFGTIIAILMIISVFFFLVAAVKTTALAYLAIAPINREPLWRSISDAFMGCISLIVMTVCLSLYLRLTTWIMGQTGGLPHQLRMFLLQIFMIVMIVLIYRARRGTLASGRHFASMLARLGLGMKPIPRDANALLKMGAVTSMAKTGYDLISKHKSKPATERMTTPTPVDDLGDLRVVPPSTPAPNRPPITAGASSQPQPEGPIDLPVVPGGQPASRKPALARKALAAGTAAVKVGRGAITGGLAGAATAAGGVVAEATVAKVASKTHKPKVEDIGEMRVVPATQGPISDSRFQVDDSGIASVRRDPKVHDISSLPPRPAPAVSARTMNRRLELEQYRTPQAA